MFTIYEYIKCLETRVVSLNSPRFRAKPQVNMTQCMFYYIRKASYRASRTAIACPALSVDVVTGQPAAVALCTMIRDVPSVGCM